MTTPAQTVAVTGASGYIGACLLRHLEEKEEINKLVAIDSRPLPFPFHNVAAFRRDVTQPIDDAPLDHQVSTVVHLAFANPLVRSRREVNLVQETNLNALTGVLELSLIHI